jgi:hypothetical protein
MERRFSVEAKSFFFSAKQGSEFLCLEEKRKGYGGFILLGAKCSGWLADMVEEAIEAQRKDDFARSFRDEVRALKVRTGRNKAGCFIEAAVFVEGNRKGVVRLLEGRGGWGWQRFVDELRSLLAQLAGKELPEDSVLNAGVGGSAPFSAIDLVAPQGDVKKHTEEVPVSVEADSVLGNQLDRGGGVVSMAALRTLAMEFLGKFRAEVDRVICFGLGFGVKASRAVRRRMGWVFSRLGLKPKVQFGCKVLGRCKPRLRIKTSSNRGVSGLKDSTEFALASPETISLAVSSSIQAELEVAQSLPERFDAGSLTMGSLSSPELEEITVQKVPVTLLTSSEFTQTVPVMVEEAPDPIDLGQIMPENTQTQGSGNPPSPELAQTDPVGSSFSSEPSGLVDVSEGSESALVLAVPEAQFLDNGLTETQVWYLGWLRDSTRNHNLLAFIDCMEEDTRRKNEVAPPPPVSSMELLKLKAMLKAGIWDENLETVVRDLALAAAAEAGVTAVPRG